MDSPSLLINMQEVVSLHSTTPNGTNLSSSLGFDAHPEDDTYEDARTHRGILRGDFMALGWSWTPDWAVARFTDLENYNFYMRTSHDGGQTWTTAANMSNIDAFSMGCP